MVANRALAPYSKLYCWEQWLREEVFLPDAQGLALHHLYAAMDFLEENKAAVEKAGSFDVEAVRKAAATLGTFSTPMGMVSFAANQSLVQKAYIGKLKADGQFEIIADSGADIQPEPYDALAFPGKTCKL